jgi:hypothetical protein
MALSRSLATDRIVTTDEVLGEYLTFFAGARTNLRHQVDRNVVELIESLEVRVVPQSRDLSLRAWSFTGPAPIKATAWSIAFRCRLCVRKASPKLSPTTGILSRKVSAPYFATRKKPLS